MVVVAQLVRALVCGTRGRGFESHLPPKADAEASAFFVSDRIGVAARHGVPDIWGGSRCQKLAFVKMLTANVQKCRRHLGCANNPQMTTKKGVSSQPALKGPRGERNGNAQPGRASTIPSGAKKSVFLHQKPPKSPEISTNHIP